MIWHLASIWEAISDAVPDATAVVNGDVRRSWREHEARAARLAGGLAAAGIGLDTKVAVYGTNSNEYIEAHFALFKLRACPINVNYRYGPPELIYLLNDCDAAAIIFDAQFAPTVAAIRAQLPKLEVLVEIDDGSGGRLGGAIRYEDLVASPPFPRGGGAEDDIYMLYTGGTTGMPKGVMYRHGDFTPALMLGYDLRGKPRPTTLEGLAECVRAAQRDGTSPVSLAASPLMHGTGLWGGVFVAHNQGGAAVTLRGAGFDADRLWRAVGRHRVTDLAIVGDVFAKPMLSALRAARAAGTAYDLSALKFIFSSGVMFSAEVKQGLLEFADATILDSMGATEGGMAASIVSRATPPSQTAVFQKNATTRVFKEDGVEVRPGSDEIGMVANGGQTPVGYYKDPVKSAATFRVIDGHRYSFPGDYAKVAADGSLILLGRGSSCINSGGEKVFPEEVEEVLKTHPDVEDCVVVGVPDERFGERVTAVVSARRDRQIDAQALTAFARARLAHFKAPRRIVPVAWVERGPNGKADLAWAKATARAATSPEAAQA